MAIYWIDYINGNDDTGDGSQTNPWKTTTNATYNNGCALPGDEIRHAKSPDPIALNGTLSWEDNSREIITSEDLTGVLSPKDFIGKGSNSETWWEISSISANKIILREPYLGINETTVSKKLGTTDYSRCQLNDTYKSGSENNPLIISGGWDLATGEKTGVTFYREIDTNPYGYGITIRNTSSHVILDNLGFLRNTSGIITDGKNTIIRNCTILSGGGDCIYAKENTIIEDCVVVGATYREASGIRCKAGSIIKRCIIMYCGTTSTSSEQNYAAFRITKNSTIEDCKIMRCKTGFYNCENLKVKNCSVSKFPISGRYHHAIRNCHNSSFTDCNIQDLQGSYSYGFYACNDLTINNCNIHDFSSSSYSSGMHSCKRLMVKNSNFKYSGINGSSSSGSELINLENSIFVNCIFETNTGIFRSPSDLKLYKCTLIGKLAISAPSAYPDNIPMVISHRENNIPYNHRNIFKYGETGCHSDFAHSGEACVRLSPADADYPVKINAIIKYIPSSANDVEVNVFAKRESDFNGTLKLKAMVLGEIIATITPAFINSEMENIPEPLPIDYDGSAPTLDWCKYKFIIPKDKLVAGEFLMIEASAIGTAGSVFVDE